MSEATLVERLRKTRRVLVGNPGEVDCDGPIFEDQPVNPEGPEAARRIETLEAENAALRHDLERQMAIAHEKTGEWARLHSALERLVLDLERSQRPGGGDPVPCYARAALAGEKGE